MPLEQVPLLKIRQSPMQSQYNPFINISHEPLVLIQGTQQFWQQPDFRGTQSPVSRKGF